MLLHLDILLGIVFIISSKGTVTPTPKLKIQSLRIIAFYQKIPLSPHSSEKEQRITISTLHEAMLSRKE